MTPQELAALREQRAAAHAQMRDLLAEAGPEGLTAEQEQTYDRVEADFDRLDGTIKRAERQAARDLSDPSAFRTDDPERDAAQREETRADRFNRAMEVVSRNPSDANMRAFIESDEYHEAFVEGCLRRMPLGLDVPREYRAALNLAVSTEGGITAPSEFIKRLLEDPQEFGIIRSLAYVFSTSHGRTMEFAELVSKGTAGWSDEVPADPSIFESEPTFGGPKTLSAYPAQREIVTSKDLLQDSVFDIEALVLRVGAESFALLENPAFVSGDGNKKPSGFIADIPAANTVTGAAGQTTTVTTDDLIDVQHALPRPYRRRAAWLFNDDTLKAIRKLTDSNGDYIWQPGLKEGAPDRILGKPYHVDDDMADQAASAKPIAYGDYSGYWIRDVLALTITPLRETYARSRQVGYLFEKRVDGVLMEPNKIAAYENSAT